MHQLASDEKRVQSTQEVLEINDVRDQIPDLEKETFLKSDDSSDKTLGLAWDPVADVSRFSFSPIQVSPKPCKRLVLSTIARIYDPLGLIGPVVAKAKIFLQQVWREKLEWDESFPQALNTSWLKLSSDMGRTHQMEILRRALDPDADGEVHLLFSKSRVAPWKTLTVSKLEFCTALTLTQLMRDVRNMKLFDSAGALSSISYEHSRFQVFVTNQISLIQKLSSGMSWHLVLTDCNPADILTRGASQSELLDSALWFRGPAILLKNQHDWPESCLPVKTPPEFRKRILVGVSTKVDLPLKRNLVNSCQKTTHTFGFEYKFAHLKRGPGLAIQMSNLADDYWRLHSKQQISSSSPLSSLLPFIDSFGLMRVGGRLQNSTLDYNAQHPVILPRQHPLSQHIIADLPKDRVNATSASMVTGLDTCGPFYYKTGVRSKVPGKTYVCVFICFATKAMHLELVQDLSTQAFLGALKRFILTRGKPVRIWSNNATNFVGAKNELAELKNLFISSPHIRAIEDFCLEDSIEWPFIPPRSPHFGGLWETAKSHFYRSVGPSLLSFDELRTLVCHIAAIVNSRPLLPLSENPADLEALTPAHFLDTVPLVLYSEPDVTKLNFNRLDRWQRISYFQQIFWSRCREEYLTLLQQRSKRRTPKPVLQINEVVFTLPPFKWPLARIMELVPGSDGVARVARISRRAVRKLCVLPKLNLVESPGPPTGGIFTLSTLREGAESERG
ncbi:uncharacterized protein LOC122320341 [Drosophila ficusphila]|uniref:uncharacterized protein LOC122320341 n=1 Tax=Drosophila ficusphila TaxID=30025 RepID=UPI001C89022C|nr:uncharacterized protein LOC122320341 [Drosophila ficusphila]